MKFNQLHIALVFLLFAGAMFVSNVAYGKYLDNKSSETGS